ncbi:CopG protein [Vibrio nigripulchritudo SFn27]|uniref:CopG protein n=2 Tax=Vibrio nigripulchritudo TaxID=28173 RepID=U4K7Y3_9VIBR|nr:CopG protein [Vibrio nigripulchritudo BLFn1]CCN90353.1 CopG protein [Vibrio nigripulchritudo SFn27]CCN94034.1 CopG protein [Vibrio nigripulchritudo ENn2]CCO42387.1 CopG protein [Vibrio nigripulchritudo SFn135]CCO51510.1 CopG protein [Vibrio nigripulchritudo Wn13]CCO58711.1 CopG protein [Vibrio nigripulchritudo]
MMKISHVVFTLGMFGSATAMAAQVVTHKSPYCGCCSEWVKHMEEAGFDVEVKDHKNLNPIKQKLGVSPELASCHTAEIEGYVFEGHIPASDIKAFLDNPPKQAVGLAVPGMPLGSPGMEYGDKKDQYDVYAFNKKGHTFVYATHNEK